MAITRKMILCPMSLLVLWTCTSNLAIAQNTQKNIERPPALGIGEVPSAGRKKGSEPAVAINDWDDAFANEVIAPLVAGIKKPADSAALRAFLLEFSGSAIATAEQEKHLGAGFENAIESPELWDEKGCSFRQTVVLKPKAIPTTTAGLARNGAPAAITFRYQFGISNADLDAVTIGNIADYSKQYLKASFKLPTMPAVMNAKTLKLQISRGFIKDNSIVFEPYSQEMLFSFVAPRGTKPEEIKSNLKELHELCSDLTTR